MLLVIYVCAAATLSSECAVHARTTIRQPMEGSSVQCMIQAQQLLGSIELTTGDRVVWSCDAGGR